MSQFLNDSVNQILEFRGIKVFYNLKDGAEAEEVLNALDKALAPIIDAFGVEGDYPFHVYLYPTMADLEKTGERAPSGPEFIRIVPDPRALLLCKQRPPADIGFDSAVAFAQLVFRERAKERQSAPWQWRTPSWLFEGLTMLPAVASRGDRIDYLRGRFMNVQENEKNGQLIKPELMTKAIALIPDKGRKQLAINQSYFMAKYLTILYPDQFSRKYVTLMGALDEMDGESIFKQITTYTFEKFFTLFREWVRTTGPWAAIAD